MRRDYRIFSGDTVTVAATARDSSGTVIDLTGASIAWRLARCREGEALVTKAVGSGVTVTDAADGSYTVTVDPADTADMCGEFVHQARVTEASGAVTTVLNGNFRIRSDIE